MKLAGAAGRPGVLLAYRRLLLLAYIVAPAPRGRKIVNA